MTFGSLFTGIGGFDLGFEKAGMECLWQVEIDKSCTQTLNKHWGGVAKYGDIVDVGRSSLKRVDVACGGFPCQDVSIAGRRAGLDGERSGLWFEFARVIEEMRPEWVVIENVPGLLSSNKGRDFAAIIGRLAELGYGFAWRVLDSKNFGVAQRRRRVFIVGHSGGSCAPPATVLFEPESLSGDIAKGRQEGHIAPTLSASGAGTSRTKARGSEQDFYVVQKAVTVLNDQDGDFMYETEDYAGTLMANMGGHQPIICIQGNMTGRKDENGPNGQGFAEEESYTLNTIDRHAIAIANTILTREGHRHDPSSETYITHGDIVRRLTPLECERLQGFPDNWTAGHSDTARYRMIGNAVTVNVAEWIGKRIMQMKEGTWTTTQTKKGAG